MQWREIPISLPIRNLTQKGSVDLRQGGYGVPIDSDQVMSYDEHALISLSFDVVGLLASRVKWAYPIMIYDVS